MTKKDFEKQNYSHQNVVDSIFHFVKTYLDGLGDKIIKIKVTHIDKDSMDTLVLVESKDDSNNDLPYLTLWSIPFYFSEMSSNDEYVIQNNAHIITKECYELPKRRTCLTEMHMTSEQASAACRTFFIREHTFEQKKRQSSKSKKK